MHWHGKISSEDFLQWVHAGKPRFESLFDAMKTSRARIKLLLRQCRQETQERTKDSLARILLSKDSKDFWKEVKNANGSGSAPLVSTINGEVDYDNIANMWHDHYQNLLNSSQDTKDKQSVLKEAHLSTKCHFSGRIVLNYQFQDKILTLSLCIVSTKVN